MSRWVRSFRVLVLGFILATTFLAPATAAAAPPGSKVADLASPAPPVELKADLDGRPLELANVSAFYCHDFAYPRIHCFSQPDRLDVAVQSILAATAANYVVVFDYAAYSGPYMYFSQDYSALAWIGWNDRISSFITQNSAGGKFWTDWFYGGSYYYFCCYQWVTGLGSYDNAFSSVFRN